MEGGHILKDDLYGELSSGARRVGRLSLRFMDACKRDIKSAHIIIESWTFGAADRNNWRQAVQSGMRKAEERRNEMWTEKRESVGEKGHRRKEPSLYPWSLYDSSSMNIGGRKKTRNNM